MKALWRLLAASLFVALGAAPALAVCPVLSGINAPFSTATNLSTEISNNVEITGGCIDNTVIGAVTPTLGTFSTVTATTVNVSGIGATTLTATQGKMGITPVTKTSAYTVAAGDSGTHFDNIGATGSVVLTLPTAAAGLNYCMAVYASFTLEALAQTGDKIASGTTEGASGGNIQSASPYDSVCFEAHGTNQWVVTSQTGTWTVN